MPTVEIELTVDELIYLGINNPDNASLQIRDLLGLDAEGETEGKEEEKEE